MKCFYMKGRTGCLDRPLSYHNHPGIIVKLQQGRLFLYAKYRLKGEQEDNKKLSRGKRGKGNQRHEGGYEPLYTWANAQEWVSSTLGTGEMPPGVQKARSLESGMRILKSISSAKIRQGWGFDSLAMGNSKK